ncbi:MAG: 4-(cytidine 5'-diphospho)-2-C-methyl-D-erythritol kinase [Chloroflexi bacterium]|nr:4-(cytidine 5'-diphospho)-2-C-methyl-D-erythritol kinase [Chloroflexota bacterium]
MLTVPAPAKLNLTLEVLGDRPDGFHEIRSVIQTISLADYLHFSPGEKLKFKSNSPGWDAGQSLVSKAVSLLQQITGCHRGATIGVEKNIPLLSGLGGDSSDAAAVLRGLNQLWDLNLPVEKLLELSRQLGTDVAFFLYGGTALVEGRGEIVTPLPRFPHRWIVLVIPPVPRLIGKTGQLYARLNAGHYSGGQITQKLVDALSGKGRFTPSMLFNTFENVAFDYFPVADACRSHLLKMGAPNVHLAGSGPALFTLLDDKARAEELYARCRQQGLESYLTDT